MMTVNRTCRKIDRLARRLYIADYDTPELLYDEICQKLPALDEAFWLHYIGSAHSGSMSSALVLILMEEGYDAEEAKAKLAGVMEDIEGIESVDILRSLRAVARTLIEEEPRVKEYDAAQIEAYLQTCGGAVRAVLDAFLERHGHRAIREAEMRSKSWHMDMGSLCSYLKSIIATGGHETPKTRTVDENIGMLLAGKKGVMRVVLKYIIGQARKGVVHREFTKSRSIKVLDIIKAGYWRLADMLAQHGILPEDDLVFFLTHDEIGQLIHGVGSGALVKKAMARRRILEEQKTFKFDEVCVGRPEPISLPSALTGNQVLKGSSISRGRATGRARVVGSVEEAEQLQPGEIMVAGIY